MYTPISIHILAHVQYAQTHTIHRPWTSTVQPSLPNVSTPPSLPMTVDRDRHVAMAAMANGGDDMVSSLQTNHKEAKASRSGRP